MFNKLEVNGEEVRPGERVYFGRAGTWWDQPAGVEAYLVAAIVIAIFVAIALVVG